VSGGKGTALPWGERLLGRAVVNPAHEKEGRRSELEGALPSVAMPLVVAISRRDRGHSENDDSRHHGQGMSAAHASLLCFPSGQGPKRPLKAHDEQQFAASPPPRGI